MPTFSEAWAIYPRRVGKKDAERAWNRLNAEQQFAAFHALPVHVRFWTVAGTSLAYIPHFSTWLNGERWTDELAMPETKKPEADWWRSTAGIEAKAKELGMWPPKAGEDWHSLKARILARAA